MGETVEEIFQGEVFRGIRKSVSFANDIFFMNP
jgi:hypothetical protein